MNRLNFRDSARHVRSAIAILATFAVICPFVEAAPPGRGRSEAARRGPSSGSESAPRRLGGPVTRAAANPVVFDRAAGPVPPCVQRSLDSAPIAGQIGAPDLDTEPISVEWYSQSLGEFPATGEFAGHHPHDPFPSGAADTVTQSHHRADGTDVPALDHPFSRIDANFPATLCARDIPIRSRRPSLGIASARCVNGAFHRLLQT